MTAPLAACSALGHNYTRGPVCVRCGRRRTAAEREAARAHRRRVREGMAAAKARREAARR